MAILRDEERVGADAEQARSMAALALRELPAHNGWEPGVDFAHDWERLVELDSTWNATRILSSEQAEPEWTPDAVAETWRMVSRLRSQPLRPVDDARFVLVRAPASLAFPVLLAATDEQDPYVRDHVLETISWIGAPCGRWAKHAQVDAVSRLSPLLGERSSRPRALEALGALGLPEAASHLLPWLQGNAEESTAAADALLRCAGLANLPTLRQASARTAEATFSLGLLLRALDPTYPEPDGARLDPAERARRAQWAAQRSFE